MPQSQSPMNDDDPQEVTTPQPDTAQQPILQFEGYEWVYDRRSFKIIETQFNELFTTGKADSQTYNHYINHALKNNKCDPALRAFMDACDKNIADFSTFWCYLSFYSICKKILSPFWHVLWAFKKAPTNIQESLHLKLAVGDAAIISIMHENSSKENNFNILKACTGLELPNIEDIRSAFNTRRNIINKNAAKQNTQSRTLLNKAHHVLNRFSHPNITQPIVHNGAGAVSSNPNSNNSKKYTYSLMRDLNVATAVINNHLFFNPSHNSSTMTGSGNIITRVKFPAPSLMQRTVSP